MKAQDSVQDWRTSSLSRPMRPMGVGLRVRVFCAAHLSYMSAKLHRYNGLLVSALLAGTLFTPESVRAAEEKVVYENSFEKSPVGKLPEEFLVLDGAFSIKEQDGNKFIELPGAPLDSFGVLFGPTESGGSVVSARVYGTGKGRRFPTFGVGLNGVGGYKLQVSPGKKLLELYKGEEVLASAPYNWDSDSWTILRLQVRQAGAAWKIEGKAWKQGTAEPTAWAISHQEKTDPSPGRASIWGSPYSTTPIRFDDLLVRAPGP